MSGPIVRKYGFPNFEKIFGERPLEHGADEGNPPTEEVNDETQPKASKATKLKSTAAPKAPKAKKSK